MDIILASSRGKDMDVALGKIHKKPEKFRIMAKSGAELSDLVERVPSILRKCKDPSNYHIYFLAGLCDITYRDHDSCYRVNEPYDEVLFMETPSEATNRVCKIIDSVAEKVLRAGAKPCFATIPPCSLNTWNNIRLNQYKTAFLLHHTHYEDMQSNLITSIIDINKYIVQTNTNNNMITPYLASTIVTNMGQNKPHRIHYSRLADGVHPTDALRDRWAEKLNKAIEDNRSRSARAVRPAINTRRPSTSSGSDSETDTHTKRSWRHA